MLRRTSTKKTQIHNLRHPNIKTKITMMGKERVPLVHVVIDLGRSRVKEVLKI
jgi:hypothetical protein